MLTILGAIGGIIGIAALAHQRGYRKGFYAGASAQLLDRSVIIKRPDMVIDLRHKSGVSVLKINLWSLVYFTALNPGRIGQSKVTLNSLELDDCKLYADGAEVIRPEWDTE